MAILSPLRHRRRTRDRQVEIKQKLLTFPIQSVWFALPIQSVFRAIEVSQLKRIKDSRMILFEERPVILIDGDKILFSKRVKRSPEFALILERPDGELLVLLIDDRPLMHQIPVEQFMSVSSSQTDSIPGVISVAPEIIERPELHLLDPIALYS
jgi:chemotaxis signal transduction protein